MVIKCIDDNICPNCEDHSIDARSVGGAFYNNRKIKIYFSFDCHACGVHDIGYMTHKEDQVFDKNVHLISSYKNHW